VYTQIKDAITGKTPSVSTKRSNHWPTIRKHHIEHNPTCAVCGYTEKLEVHHIQQFHLYPELELEPSNLITMCESKSYGIICHLLIGHNGSYRNINPNVVEDAAAWNKKLKESNTQPIKTIL